MYSNKVVFRLVLDNAVIIEWYKPQIWSHVFKMAKLLVQCEKSNGCLYCNSNDKMVLVKHLTVKDYSIWR